VQIYTPLYPMDAGLVFAAGNSCRVMRAIA
jgi:hypothetical protein